MQGCYPRGRKHSWATKNSNLGNTRYIIHRREYWGGGVHYHYGSSSQTMENGEGGWGTTMSGKIGGCTIRPCDPFD